MDELAVADIHADMGDPGAAFGGEEDQVARLQVFFGDTPAGAVLTAGDAGEVEPVEAIADHGQAAAVETVVAVRSSPAIRDADEAAGGADQLIAQVVAVPGRGACNGIIFGVDDEKVADQPLGLQFFSFGPGAEVIGVIAEANFVQAGLMPEIIGVNTSLGEDLLQSHCIVQVTEGADLNAVAHLGQWCGRLVIGRARVQQAGDGVGVGLRHRWWLCWWRTTDRTVVVTVGGTAGQSHQKQSSNENLAESAVIHLPARIRSAAAFPAAPDQNGRIPW